MPTIAKPVTIETTEERYIAGLAKDFTLTSRHQIPDLWQAYFNAAPVIEEEISGAMFGVSFNADGKGAFRYAVGAEVSTNPKSLPKGFCTVALSAGDYAVRRLFGPVAELPAQLDDMFHGWLPQSDFVQRDGAAFERYPDDSRNGPDGMAYEIWVPVRRKS